MNPGELLKLYNRLRPGFEKLYVFPHIERSSQFNLYLSLLYSEFLNQGENPSVTLKSTTFFTPLIVIKRILTEKSIVHHHWFECSGLISFLNAIWKLFSIFCYRTLGGKFVWSVHNKYPHHRKWRYANVLMSKILARLSHRLIVHCNEAVSIMSHVLKISPDKFSVIKHPDYPVKIIEREDARRLLPESSLSGRDTLRGPVSLIFGYVARYKGIVEVMEIFSKLYTPGRGTLIIAGKIKDGEEDYGRMVDKLASECDGIFFNNRFIPDEELFYYISAADYVLFNFTEILYSGGVHLAMNCKKKIILPDIGCLKELKGENIFKFRNREELKSIIERLN